MGARRCRPWQILLNVRGLTIELWAESVDSKRSLPLLGVYDVDTGLSWLQIVWLSLLGAISQLFLTNIVEAREPVFVLSNR